MNNWQDKIQMYKRVLDVIDIGAKKITKGSEATNSELLVLRDGVQTILIEEENFCRDDIITAIKRIFDRVLKPRDALILKEILVGKTLEKIASQLGITASRCSQIYAKFKNNAELTKALQEAGIKPSDLSIVQTRQAMSVRTKPSKTTNPNEFADTVHDFNNMVEQTYRLREELIADLKTGQADEEDIKAFHILRKKIMMMRPRYGSCNLCGALRHPRIIAL